MGRHTPREKKTTQELCERRKKILPLLKGFNPQFRLRIV